MKRSIAILLGLLLAAGAGLAQAGRSGGFHGGGGRAVAMGARPAPSGGFTRFTTGPMHFTTGPHPIGRPPGIIARPFPIPPHPIHSHPVIIGGGVIVAAPIFFPPPPYPYYPYPYPYAEPVAGGPAYVEPPTYSDAQPYPDSQPNSETPGYSERNDYWYYCPDSQAYYPYVKTCPSPWVQVLPQPDGTAN